MNRVVPSPILALASVVFVLLLSSGAADARDRDRGGEYIVVAGGPALREWEDLRKNVDQHDRYWYKRCQTTSAS